MKKITYKIYFSIEEIPNDWDAFGTDTFLQLPYLKAQEIATPSNMDYFYVAFFQEKKFIGKSVVQRIRMKGKELFPADESKFKDELLNLLNMNLLCVGNIKLTGVHAWELQNGVEEKLFIKTLHTALNEIRKISKKEKLPIKLLLIKDFYENKSTEIHAEFSDFEKLSVQPNMIFHRNAAWSTFEEYLMAMRTKYRTRAKRAFKKAADITFRELNFHEVVDLQDKMYQLYLNVLKNNSFSMYKLPQNFFTEMKREMPQNMKIFGGFIDRELVCFYTIIENQKQLEAGFLGYKSEIQHEKQLYLNMLYKMVDYTVSNQFHSIDFSRTAMEIKSSVGAEPFEMYGFLKHTHPLMNKVIRSTFKKFYQPENWIQRKPFKE